MDIGEAIAHLYGMSRLCRERWKAENPYDPTFIYLVPGSVFKVQRKPLLGIFPEGTEIQYRSHIDAIRIAEDDKRVAWYYDFTQEDLVAQDWKLYVSAEQLRFQLEVETLSNS